MRRPKADTLLGPEGTDPVPRWWGCPWWGARPGGVGVFWMVRLCCGNIPLRGCPGFPEVGGSPMVGFGVWWGWVLWGVVWVVVC